MSNWLDFRLIKREADLESVLRHYGVELRRSGKDQYRGRCPIHRGEGRDAFHANTARKSFIALLVAQAERYWTSSQTWSAALCMKPPKSWRLRLSPGVRQPVKRLGAVRW